MNNLLEKLRQMDEQEIYSLVYSDPLTGVGNRRAYDEDARGHLAIIDLDSLKYVNDTLGHRYGDRQLLNLACVLVLTFGHDNVYRISGDEFAVKFDEAPDDARFRSMHRLFPGFSYGIGQDVVSADAALSAQKALRERLGLRASRGERPAWFESFQADCEQVRVA